MRQNTKQVLTFILQLKFFVFLIAFLNFAWFFSHSKIVEEFGSEAITFCASCTWYYEGSQASKPFILLFATLFMVFNRCWGYLITGVISGLYVIEGIIWISQGKGFVSGVSERIEIISIVSHEKIWEFIDWQYLLALIIFIVALGYLIDSFIETKQNHLHS